uniref:Citrolysin protein 1 n=1 Tax=Citrobacter freundii TaxID=546 RepID=CIR1_CITFR|nr:RecName: Full=Citrolysin protein 1 [Citrobacter freundii]prf//1501260A citrolysin [Citrobacter freundii]
MLPEHLARISRRYVILLALVGLYVCYLFLPRWLVLACGLRRTLLSCHTCFLCEIVIPSHSTQHTSRNDKVKAWCLTSEYSLIGWYAFSGEMCAVINEWKGGEGFGIGRCFFKWRSDDVWRVEVVREYDWYGRIISRSIRDGAGSYRYQSRSDRDRSCFHHVFHHCPSAFYHLACANLVRSCGDLRWIGMANLNLYTVTAICVRWRVTKPLTGARITAVLCTRALEFIWYRLKRVRPASLFHQLFHHLRRPFWNLLRQTGCPAVAGRTRIGMAKSYICLVLPRNAAVGGGCLDDIIDPQNNKQSPGSSEMEAAFAVTKAAANRASCRKIPMLHIGVSWGCRSIRRIPEFIYVIVLLILSTKHKQIAVLNRPKDRCEASVGIILDPREFVIMSWLFPVSNSVIRSQFHTTYRAGKHKVNTWCSHLIALASLRGFINFSVIYHGSSLNENYQKSQDAGEHAVLLLYSPGPMAQQHCGIVAQEGGDVCGGLYARACLGDRSLTVQRLSDYRVSYQRLRLLEQLRAGRILATALGAKLPRRDAACAGCVAHGVGGDVWRRVLVRAACWRQISYSAAIVNLMWWRSHDDEYSYYARLDCSSRLFCWGHVRKIPEWVICHSFLYY